MVSDYEALQALCRENLSSFTAKAFTLAEPATPFEHNWHIDCIAEHLQAVWNGEISKLVINMPPRSLKTLTTSIAFPAWGMGKNPSIRFMLTSYKASLAEKMTRKTRLVMRSNWYQDCFPNTRLSDELNRQYYFETTELGQYFSSSMSSATGEGCDIQICFPYDAIVHTERGGMQIGDIVRSKKPLRVWSYNEKTGKQELKRVYRWVENPASDIVEVKLNDGRSVKCTPDHKFLTKRGMIEARDLLPSDMLPRLSAFYVVNRSLAYTKSLLQDFVRLITCADKQNVRFRQNRSFDQMAYSGSVHSFEVVCKFRPQTTRPYRINGPFFNPIFSRDGKSIPSIRENRNGLILRKFGAWPISTDRKRAVVNRITDILRARTVSKIVKGVIGFIAVQVPHFASFWSFSLKGHNNRLVRVNRLCAPIYRSHYSKIPMRVLLKFKNSLGEIVPHLPVPSLSFFGAYFPNIRNAISSFISGYGSPISVTNSGHVDSTFCLSVEDNHNFYCGDGQGIVISNCDDPLNPDEALSDQVRQSAIETIRGTLFSRFNDPRKTRFILNMQRLHEADPAGDLLKDGGWTHLKLPAEAVEKTHHIILGNKEWTLEKGEMLFKERFTREVLDEKRMLLGDYNYAGQFLQEPVPLGGGILKPHLIEYYAQGGCRPKEMNIVILIDPAGGDEKEKKKKDKPSDWTAMMVVGLAPDQNYYLLDVVRDRLDPSERVDTAFMLVRKWNELGAKTPKVGYEKYSMQSDIHYLTKKKNDEGFHFPIIELGGPKSKTTRIQRLEPYIQNGRWYFPQSLMYVDKEGKKWDLVREIVDTEMPSFPRGRFDDMIDALSRVYEPELFLTFPQPRPTITHNTRGDDNMDDYTQW